MFAGLPGIGVGTLFYVLIALWMPFREIPLVVRGQSSLKRWALIVKQLVFSAGILGSIAAADRAISWWLGGSSPRAVGPARWVNEQLGASAPHTVLAAPITASLLLLGLVLLVVEVGRLLTRFVSRPGHVGASATVSPAHASRRIEDAESEGSISAGASLVAD